MMPYISGQVEFEDGDLGNTVKVTITKKLKNTKKFAKNSNMHVYKFYLRLSSIVRTCTYPDRKLKWYSTELG